MRVKERQVMWQVGGCGRESERKERATETGLVRVRMGMLERIVRCEEQGAEVSGSPFYREGRSKWYNGISSAEMHQRPRPTETRQDGVPRGDDAYLHEPNTLPPRAWAWVQMSTTNGMPTTQPLTLAAGSARVHRARAAAE